MPASITVAAVTSWLIQAAVTFAISMVVTRIFGQKPPSPVDNGVREQIPPATVNSLPVVYGDAYLGGVFVDAALSQNQKTMYYVFAISSISPNGQFSYNTNKFYYGDRLITFDSSDPTKVIKLTDGTGNFTTKISGKLFINLYVSDENGTITSLNGAPAPSVVMGSGIPAGVDYKGIVADVSDLPASPSINDGYIVQSYIDIFDGGIANVLVVWDGTDWVPTAYDKTKVIPNLAWSPTNRQMYGTAFAIVKLNYNASSGTTSLSPITFHCSHYLNSQGCAKPGDVWVDYLSNQYYGGAADPTLIDFASATALNEYSDELITFTNNSGSPATQPRYRINGVLDTGTNVLENIDKIVTACDSWMTYDAAKGQWSVIANKPQSVALNFNDSNIVGEIRVSATDINQSINQIEAKFPNKLNKDIPDYVYLETPSDLLFPNEPVNKFTQSFDLINDSVQAQYIANRILEQAREDLIVVIKTTYNGIQVNAGDVISITNSAYGWDNKLFRVMKVNEASLPDGNLGASLELNEYNVQVYDDKDITQFSPSDNSGLPNITDFGDLTAPTITDQLPTAAVPSFSVECVLPPLGQITLVSLYYTTNATPTNADWNLWSVQATANSEPYVNGSTLKFENVGLPTNIYYFAFKVGNQTGESELSPLSSSYDWQPNPSSSAVAGTFVTTFSPPILQVPYTTGPVFTGINPKLYGSTAGGAVDFVPAQTDSDASFVNNTWRIGGSDTTGYGDIVKTNITIGNPTDAGFYAEFPAPTAMPSEPANIDVPVRYKSTDGTVYQSATAILQLVYSKKGDQGDAGENGNQASIAYLYQWASAQPANPNGNSTFNWSTGTNTNYTGGNNWTTTIPANPGTPSIKLWVASKAVTDTAIAVTTTVSWASGFSVYAESQNGATGTSGLQSARAIVYQWAATIPASPTGTSIYTWSSGTFTPTPSGWTLSPSTSPTAGFTLWQASVQLVDSATVSTSTVNWSTSSISAAGYAGNNGATGTTGASARICYTKTTLSALASTPTTITTTGSSSFPPNNSWGTGTVWQATPPSIVEGESVYQSDGIYSPTTNNTIWNVPYISALKVGSLSAISVNTGGLTVTDFIKAGTNPAVSGTSMTGTGFTLNSGGTFAIGNSSKNLSFNGSQLTMNGDLVVTGNIVNNAITTQSNYQSLNRFLVTEFATLTNTWYDIPNALVSLNANAGSFVKIDLSMDMTVYGSSTDKAYFRIANGTITNKNNAIGYTSYGVYVMVGDNGQILISNNGFDWTNVDSGITANLKGVTWSWQDKQIVAVGDNGTIITSPDGFNWTQRTSGTTQTLNAVYCPWNYQAAIANGRPAPPNQYVAVGANGTILSSTNGISWTTRTSNTTNSLNAVSYLQDITGVGITPYWIAVGAGGVVRYSSDLVTWQTGTSGTTNNLNAITFYPYTDNRMIVGGAGGVARYTVNGTTWSSVTTGVTADIVGFTSAAGSYDTTNNYYTGVYAKFITSTGVIRRSGGGISSYSTDTVPSGYTMTCIGSTTELSYLGNINVGTNSAYGVPDWYLAGGNSGVIWSSTSASPNTFAVQSVYKSLGAAPYVYVDNQAVNFAFSFIDPTPTVGNNNYQLQVRRTTGDPEITSISLTGIVYKK